MAKDFDLLVGNAFDFLSKAIGEVESQPKFSIINFYSAVELFLKARLLADHWSLVVNKDADRKKFEAGDFVSVSFEVACERLNKIVQSPLPETTKASFDAIRKHRNQMVHFHHAIQSSDTVLIQTIAKEQFVAWYYLHKLLTEQWGTLFGAYKAQIASIEIHLKPHRGFLSAKFSDLESQLASDKATGKSVRKCGVCKFVAAVETAAIGSLTYYKCKVCDYGAANLVLECSDCANEGDFDGGNFICADCGYEESVEAVVERFAEVTPANCAWCDGHQTVAEFESGYLCLACLEHVDEIAECEWCGEANTGDMSESYLLGCGHCDGKGGWDSRDD